MSIDISPEANALDLSLEEKAALSGGADFWSTKAIGSVPSVLVTDGPHGLRKQDAAAGADHLGIGASVPAQRAGHLLPARRWPEPDLGS
jgi:beta-glucosidase